MNVFMISGDTDYGLVHTGTRENAVDYMYAASGKPSAEGWAAPRLEPQIYRKKVWMVWVDCVLSVVPNGEGLLLGRRAREQLCPLISQCGELLPIELDDQDYQWFNCLAMLEGAVDNANTKGSKYRYGDHEAWERVTDWAFNAEKLADAPPIFRVPEDPFRRHFCTEATAKAIRSSGLIGFNIKKVWTSVPGEDGEPPVTFPATFDVTSDYERRDEIKAKRRAAISALAERVK